MNQVFSNLTQEEYKQLKDAFALITMYVAGADGSIEDEEIKWAEKVTNIRSYKMTEDLKDFYNEVNENFNETLTSFIQSIKGTKESINQTISDKLKALNPILAKLDAKTGSKLYNGYLSFATHVAKSTGGFLGFFSINAEEKKLLSLSMLNPIIFEEEGEEE